MELARHVLNANVSLPRRMFQIVTPEFQERKLTIAHCKAWRGGQRQLPPMDILASMFAYLVCVTGLVAGLAMSFVIFFSAPGQFASAPSQAIVLAARSSHGDAVKISPVNKVSPVKTIAGIGASDRQTAAAELKPIEPPTIAIDARQKPLASHAVSRRLAERARAKQLASRERSSFETRFLHFDD
jgi:hypothetical protein